MNVLVVNNPFGGRKTGEKITDPAEIAAVMAGENSRDVIRSEHAEPAKPKASKEA